MFKWLEKKLRRIVATVFPEHSMAKRFGSPRQGNSKEQSSSLSHSKVVPIAESASREAITVRKALQPVCELEYLPGSEVGEGSQQFDEKVQYEVKQKSGKSDRNHDEAAVVATTTTVATTDTASEVEMKLKVIQLQREKEGIIPGMDEQQV